MHVNYFDFTIIENSVHAEKIVAKIEKEIRQIITNLL